MADVTVKRVEEVEGIFGGVLRRVRAGLGVTSFGITVFDFPANSQGHHEHDESGSGQEEVYTALSGSAILRVGDEEHSLEPGVFARVGPSERRKIVTGPEAARILVLGGVPGKVYEPPDFSEEGGPRPGE